MDPAALRERVLADIRRQLAVETASRATTASGSQGDRRRHPRPRPARAAPRRRFDHGDHGQRPSRDLDRARGPALRDDVRFNDEWHLRRIINKMVAQVGRRIDESSPMVDARLPDGSRVNAIIPPLSLTGPLITIRKFPQKRLTLDDMIKLGTISPEAVEFLSVCVQRRAEHAHLRRHGLGQDDAAQRAVGRDPEDERIVTIEDAAELRLNQEHVLRLESRPKNIEGRRRDPDPRARAQLVAHASRPDHRRRGSRRGGARHAPGDEHRPRRLALDDPREHPARRASPRRDDGADGRVSTCRSAQSASRSRRRSTDRPPRAARGRLPPRLVHHRGAADGVGRDHAAGACSSSRSTRSWRTGRSSAPSGRRACGRRSSQKFEKHGMELPAKFFGKPPTQLAEVARGNR